MGYDITIAPVDRRPTLVARFHAPPHELGARFLEWLPRVADVVIAAGCRVVAAPFARYLGADGDVLHVEAGLVLDREVRGQDDIFAADLPGGHVAKTVHVGSYATLGEAHSALRAWVASNGRSVTGAPYELYVSDPSEGDDDPAHWRTEVYIPVSGE